jgi:hypothetical protein
MNADGSLVSWQSDVNNQVVSRDAYLQLAAIRVDSGPDHFSGFVGITVNGSFEVHQIDEQHLCVKISSQFLKFGQRTLSGAGPMPGNNVFSIVYRPAWCSTARYGSMSLDYCAASIGFSPVSIAFNAMAPIVMVHGIKTDETWFVVNHFVDPFLKNHLPYTAIKFRGDVNIPSGTALIALKIQQVARGFGANHVHIIAHSKGGLWTRQFLTHHLSGTNLGVFSVHMPGYSKRG